MHCILPLEDKAHHVVAGTGRGGVENCLAVIAGKAAVLHLKCSVIPTGFYCR